MVGELQPRTLSDKQTPSFHKECLDLVALGGIKHGPEGITASVDILVEPADLRKSGIPETLRRPLIAFLAEHSSQPQRAQAWITVRVDPQTIPYRMRDALLLRVGTFERQIGQFRGIGLRTFVREKERRIAVAYEGNASEDNPNARDLMRAIQDLRDVERLSLFHSLVALADESRRKKT